MAAVSAPHAANALTPPSSSHGVPNAWSYSGQPQDPSRPTDENEFSHPGDRKVLASQTNGSSIAPQTTRPELSQKRTDTINSSHTSKSNQVIESGYLAPARISALNRKDSNISDTGSASDSLLDLYGPNSANRSGLNSMDLGDRDANGEFYGNEEDPERSRWIHRDKLARIESQELQAAGIVLPRARAPSKSSRRERSRDQHSNGFGRSEEAGQYQKRQKMGELPFEGVEDQPDIIWDLRTPEEAAEDRYTGWKDYSNGQKGVSRIPLFTESPLPVPLDYIARDTPIQRSRTLSVDDDPILVPKSRGQGSKSVEELVTTTTAKRVASKNSPSKKTTPGIHKESPPATRVASAAAANSGRPKTRSGQKDAPSRPPTRSGELGPANSLKKPEGDPPWLASMYKPDPRLPPDQQLLPTVAKRLQQERWEKEGKGGTLYDREFRPLNDEDFQQPDILSQTVVVPDQKPEEQEGWPLRTTKSPTLGTTRPGTAGGYSTIPKIQDVPVSPLAPKSQNTPQPLRLQEPSEEEDGKKKGCGCCIVM